MDMLREQSFELAQSYWKIPDTATQLEKHHGKMLDEKTMEKAKAAVKTSQKKEFAQSYNSQSDPREAKVSVGKGFTTNDVQGWLSTEKQRKKKTM